MYEVFKRLAGVGKIMRAEVEM